MSTLEIQRARRALDAFCERRSRAQSSFVCRHEGNELIILEVRGDDESIRPLLRLGYSEGAWHVFWPRNNGKWEPYLYLPVSGSIHQILDELERVPLYIHWEQEAGGHGPS